jgi:EF hand
MKAKLTLIASALLLMSTIAGAQEQSQSTKMTGQQAPSAMGCKGTMGQGMHHGGMYRMMFVLMDTDGDGTLSLEEFQAAHAKIFKAIDANKDGKVTFEEMQAFFRGGSPTPDQ